MSMIDNLKNFLIVNFILLSFFIPREMNYEEITRVSNSFLLEKKVNLEIDNITLDSINNYNLFYVVNLNPIGFIIVSAHDLTIPIIGYSFNSMLDLDALPSQLDQIISSYRSNIIYSIG